LTTIVRRRPPSPGADLHPTDQEAHDPWALEDSATEGRRCSPPDDARRAGRTEEITGAPGLDPGSSASQVRSGGSLSLHPAADGDPRSPVRAQGGSCRLRRGYGGRVGGQITNAHIYPVPPPTSHPGADSRESETPSFMGQPPGQLLVHPGTADAGGHRGGAGGAGSGPGALRRRSGADGVAPRRGRA
jgi:hypothetical protein